MVFIKMSSKIYGVYRDGMWLESVPSGNHIGNPHWTKFPFRALQTTIDKADFLALKVGGGARSLAKEYLPDEIFLVLRFEPTPVVGNDHWDAFPVLPTQNRTIYGGNDGLIKYAWFERKGPPTLTRDIPNLRGTFIRAGSVIGYDDYMQEKLAEMRAMDRSTLPSLNASFPNGVVCERCNMGNPFGVPNKGDKYICFECR